MPKYLSPEEIRVILEGGNLDELIGVVEDEHLECKGAPYQLKHDHQKQEFAKDVSGLANADGGIILIGVRTERDPTHFGDEIRETSIFPQALFNPKRYHDVLRSWIYPPPQQVEVRWFPSKTNPERGIGAILIPLQSPSHRPFLVTRTIDDKGKRIEVVFGYFERQRANVDHMSVQELHTMLRDGLQYDLATQQYENIQETLQHVLMELARTPRVPTGPNITELLRERIEEALTEADLLQRPTYILSVLSPRPVEIPTLFERRDAEIVRLLQTPPFIRYPGFHLGTGGQSRIVRGQLRRSVLAPERIIDLWRDGTLIFTAPGDEDFLCWGRRARPGAPLRINQLCLIESTYLFVELSRRVFEQAQPQPRELQYRLELRNMTVAGRPCSLIPGPVGTMASEFGMNIHEAPDSNAQFTVNWEDGEIHTGTVTFDLVREVYVWFGIEEDGIPYAEQLGDRPVISRDQIKSVR